ncbi:hypothetical protein ZIOFF_018425 [Zingiber officinale]|uniref:Polygalacturonase n=1 Tax=Zingiber officinale TaxID=94328 RepID=A0A8J5LQS2_ZINOF|nr:hypothetical protein ZIOFF_018425 [Zingiber officinale]
MECYPFNFVVSPPDPHRQRSSLEIQFLNSWSEEAFIDPALDLSPRYVFRCAPSLPPFWFAYVCYIFDLANMLTKFETKSNQAFEAAWAAACKAGDSVLVVIAEFEFLVGPISFSGPYCQPNIVFQLDGMIIAPTNAKYWASGLLWWIEFTKLKGIAIRGSGVIEGRGSVWWTDTDSDVDPALRFYGSYNVSVTGITIQNSQQCHLKFDNCKAVQVYNIMIASPGNSLNTDGIHLQNSRDVMIHHANMSCAPPLSSWAHEIAAALHIISKKDVHAWPFIGYFEQIVNGLLLSCKVGPLPIDLFTFIFPVISKEVPLRCLLELHGFREQCELQDLIQFRYNALLTYYEIVNLHFIFPAGKYLVVGVVDGRNIRANDFASSLSTLASLEAIVGKVDEVNALAKVLASEKDEVVLTAKVIHASRLFFHGLRSDLGFSGVSTGFHGACSLLRLTAIDFDFSVLPGVLKFLVLMLPLKSLIYCGLL